MNKFSQMSRDERIDQFFADGRKLYETSVKHCQSCGVDFKEGQVVYYVPLDNNIVCPKCAAAHYEKEQRKVKV